MRPAVVAVALLLAGCGFMQVGERPIPSIAGSVAATAWRRGIATALATPVHDVGIGEQ